jgi:hypothetical protein
MKKLSIVVFGFSAQSILEWLGKHRELIARQDIDFHFAYYEGLIDSKVKPSNFFLHKGEENNFERIRNVVNFLDSEFVLLAASDDQILQLPILEDDSDVDMVVGNTFFTTRVNSVLSPSNTNNLKFYDSKKLSLLGYWSKPCPGDNSIYYSIVRLSILKMVYSIYPANLIFHAPDWAFVHFLLSISKVEKNTSFVQVRDTTASYKYTQGIIKKYPDFNLTNTRNLVLQNPIGYCLKYIYENDLKFSNELNFEIIESMFVWVNLKLDELVKQGVTVCSNARSDLTLFSFADVLINASLDEFSVYEA